MKNIKILLVFFTLNILAGSSIIKAQEKGPDAIKRMVESQNFVFKAETANPQGGSSRQLSSSYDLTVTKKSLIAYLPYFGRAYTAPADPSETGIKFTSTVFEYKPVKNNNSWEITIRPNDVRNVQQMYLVIFDNGRATLQVMNINRQDISFSGYIK